MPIVLFRVDERLIHGQVVLGWGSQLRAQRFVVVDDGLAASEWEQELYRLGVGSAEAEFASVEQARSGIARWRQEHSRTILLTRDVPTLCRLARGGLLEGESVNLGGLHDGPGRSQALTYLYLTDDDRQALKALERDEGVSVSARDLPDAPNVTLEALLGP